jgi:hypothetical protein
VSAVAVAVVLLAEGGEPSDGDAAAGAQQHHVGGGREGQRVRPGAGALDRNVRGEAGAQEVGRGVVRSDDADDDLRQRDLRAISISVWPNGAARGRAPSASSGASARCSRGGSRRHV